jgi:hypothetical protein
MLKETVLFNGNETRLVIDPGAILPSVLREKNQRPESLDWRSEQNNMTIAIMLSELRNP